MKWVNLHGYGLGAVMTLVLMFATGCQSSAPPVNEPNFKDVVKNSSITIYPTVVANPAVLLDQATYDPDEARALGEWVKLTSDITVKYSDDHLRSVKHWRDVYRGGPHDGIESLKAHVQANPVDTDYAAIAAYQIIPESGATAIFLFVVTKEGELARWFWANNRNQVFRDANPQTPTDCTTLLVNIIDDRVRIREKTEQMIPLSE